MQRVDVHRYCNYKGWHSILVVTYVNSYYLFAHGLVASPGKMADTGALKSCEFLHAISADDSVREAWLGRGGLIAGDGGTHDEKGILLTPIPGPTTPQDLWYNFCHSSTRFFVEETFGRWKNKFRVLLTEMHIPYKLATQIIASTMVLHNYIALTKTAEHDMFICCRDWGWDLHFQTYLPMLCPSCKRLNAIHCPHIKKNRKVKPSQPTPCGRRNRQTIRDIMWEAVLEDEVDYVAIMKEARSDRESRAAQRADAWSMPPPPSHPVDDDISPPPSPRAYRPRLHSSCTLH